MKKPDEKKTSTNPKPKSGENADDASKKTPAKPGTVASKDVGSGDGKSAAASGEKIKPAESTVVGSGKGGKPAAEAKASGTTSSAAKPAETKQPETKLTQAKPAEAKSASAGVPVVPKAASGAATASEASKTSQTTAQAKTSAEASATSTPKSDEGSKGSAKDAPGEAVLRDTPASASAPKQNVTVKKTGFWPVALGGVVAAGVGAAATLWALPNLPASWLPEVPVQEVAPAEEIDVDAIRADAVSAAEAAAREEVDVLRAEIAAATPVEAPAVEAPAAANEPETQAAPAVNAASAEQVAALQTRLEEQAAQIEELAARPVLDPEVAQKVQSVADQAGALEQQIQAAAESAQSEISAVQAEAQKLQDAAEESTRRAEAVAAVASLQAALDRGVTPDEARETLEGAGIDTPEPLTREVPSLVSLQEGFGDAARASLRASLREDSSTGGGNPLTNFLRAQTGARSVEVREGDDPDAILSRANAEIEAGRIGAALDEISGLSDAARSVPAMAEWMSGANAYRDAQAALSDLSATSN